MDCIARTHAELRDLSAQMRLETAKTDLWPAAEYRRRPQVAIY